MRAIRQSTISLAILGACLALVCGSALRAAEVPAAGVDPYIPAGGYGANQASRIAPPAPRVASPDTPAPQPRNALSWTPRVGEQNAYREPPGSIAQVGGAPPFPVQPAAHADPLPIENTVRAAVGLPSAPPETVIEDTSSPPPSAVPARRAAGIPLAPPNRDKASAESPAKAPSSTGSIVTVATSLAIVLGLFFLAIWFLRRGMPGGPPQLPSDAVAVLGQLPLSGRQTLHLVRLGGKLILICSNGEESATLTEITELTEVERIAATCAAAQSTSTTATFRDLLTQMSAEPAAPGFLGESGRPARDLVSAYGGQDDD